MENFSGDPLYPRIARVVEQILREGKVVAPVDVLVRMDLLRPERLEDWRFGRVPYLERVIQMRLSRLSKLLRILRFHAGNLNLVPSITVYARWGKGPRERLRFTKTGEPRLEDLLQALCVAGQGAVASPERTERRTAETGSGGARNPSDQDVKAKDLTSWSPHPLRVGAPEP